MKIKTSELTGTALDWAVAKCEDETDVLFAYRQYGKLLVRQAGCHETHDSEWPYEPSTDWAQGGPIMTRERISRTIDHSGLWIAYWTDGYTEGDEGRKWMQCDRSELVAGLRCYVASKLGDELEIPNELIGELKP